MKLKDIHPTFREALGMHEGFRKCGFAAEDIYVYLNPDLRYVTKQVDNIESADTFDKPGKREMLVVLKTQGKEFRATVGMIEMTRDEWESAWSLLG